MIVSVPTYFLPSSVEQVGSSFLRDTRILLQLTRTDFVSLAESLRARLQELRTRRDDLEKVREEVIRHLKHIHNRITLRRKEGEWQRCEYSRRHCFSPLRFSS